ncbi:peptidyl-prolyl cis-trans isomerase A (cyclophilin A) [Murinocardiopsis flavida]|uniref:Peptidyl-prolyl cis-trans isomerase n=1 Tax=Murinocardiopsis flavida TaxID=645275 RepID=A0A2P8CZ48_9ACTN|nr:peptidylprolyl isomerase [Murinocardiopsis flavida]PSK90233.1 peptidyl-prolyl cis-trans isomerase A (cyclophilin A) [Murinocardiopsis flavida]
MNRFTTTVLSGLLGAALLTATSCGGGASDDAAAESEGVTGATLKTSEGDIKVTLFPDTAPETVANFAGLAEGGKAENPKTGAKRFYDDTLFHRVIPGFMVQGGDPLGNGTGGPGYTFEDEIDPDLSFDEPGKLAMANSGKHTNGSQFFVTTAPAPHIDGKHTIFGEVADKKSQQVADAISKVETGPDDRPAEDVVLESITINRADG